MRNLLLSLGFLFTCLCSSIYCSAQEYERDFGIVSAEDFSFKKVDSEPNAEAVILFDKGKSYFTRGHERAFDLVFERHIRIKILTDAGLRWADQYIPLHRNGVDMEVVDQLDAITFNINNGQLVRTELDPKTTFDEKVNDYLNYKKFAMPAVQVGSILDISYRVVSPFVFRFNDWRFQSKLPTLYSFFEGRLIPFYEYVYIIIGSPNLTIHKSFVASGKSHFEGIDYSEVIYQFASKNIPSFVEEDFFASEDDHVQRIDFQLSRVTQANGQTREIITTWPKLISSLEKHQDFGKYLSKAGKAANEITIPGADHADPMEKVKAITNYVKSNFSWDGYYGKYASKQVKDLMEQNTGSNSDINLFLIGLLKANGLEAYPVIISTRGHGRVYRDYPFDSFFNYVIALVKVGEKEILLDGTEVNSAYNELPIRCINDAGLLVKEGEERWINVRSDIASGIFSEISISFSDQLDSIYNTRQFQAKGYEGLVLRNNCEDKTQRIHDLYADAGQKLFNIETENYKEPALPYILGFSSSLPTENVNGKVYFSPFLNAAPSEPMFKAPSRKYPVDLIYERQSTFVSELKVPEGYKLETIPANYKLDNVLYSLSFSAEEINANTYKFTGVFDLKYPVYRPEHYPAIRMANNKAVDLFNQKIALVPVN